MGEILSTKASNNNKIIYKILLNEKEARNLQNHTKNVHIFPEGMCIHESKILEKGTQKSAKYFLVPKSFKSRKKARYTRISYQKIEKESQVFYIIVANKNILYY